MHFNYLLYAVTLSKAQEATFYFVQNGIYTYMYGCIRVYYYWIILLLFKWLRILLWDDRKKFGQMCVVSTDMRLLNLKAKLKFKGTFFFVIKYRWFTRDKRRVYWFYDVIKKFKKPQYHRVARGKILILNFMVCFCSMPIEYFLFWSIYLYVGIRFVYDVIFRWLIEQSGYI